MIQVMIFLAMAACAAIATVLSKGKSVFSRVLMLVSVPVSYAISILLAKIGTWNFISNAIASYVVRQADIEDLTNASNSLSTGLTEIISFVFVHVFAVIVFLLILVGLHFAIMALDKRKERNKKRGVSIALSCLFAVVVFMFSLLPLSMASQLLEDTVDSTFSEEYKSSGYSGAYSICAEIEKGMQPDAPLGFVCRYSGIGPLHNLTTEFLSYRSIITNEGEKKDLQCVSFGKLIIRDTFDVLSLADKLDNSRVLNYANLKQAYNVLESVKRDSTLHIVADELSEHYFLDVLQENEKYKVVIYLIIQIYLKGVAL